MEGHRLLFFCLAILFSFSHAQTNVPLVTCESLNITGCVYIASFLLNGTLPSSQWTSSWNYFLIDLTDLVFNSSCGISITNVYLSPQADITLFARRLKEPDSSDYDSKQEFACNHTSSCWYNFGICDPSKEIWYIGVQNTGNLPASYQLKLQILPGAGGILGCLDFSGIATAIIITLSVIGGVCLLCIVAGIIIGCCMCRRQRRRQVYMPVKQYNSIAAPISYAYPQQQQPPSYPTLSVQTTTPTPPPYPQTTQQPPYSRASYQQQPIESAPPQYPTTTTPENAHPQN